jgi:hypothetical protein
MGTEYLNHDHTAADTSMGAAKRIAQASVIGSAAASSLLTATSLGHSPSAAAVAIAAAVVVAVITIQVIGPQLATLLWLACYSRMLHTTVRKGIAYTKDMDDVHRLISDLHETQTRMSAACSLAISCQQRTIRSADSAAPENGLKDQP